MVRRFVESDDSYLDSNEYVNTRRIECILEYTEMLEQLTPDQLEGDEITAAIKAVYDAVFELEGPIAKVTA